MRQEIIKCDTCGTIHDAQYVLPSEWITTRQITRYQLEEERHFCSRACLVTWATQESEEQP